MLVSPHRSPAGSPALAALAPLDLLRVARPGLIASHLWIYLLPAALAGAPPGAAYWVGALYVTVPLGLLIYGWNDYFDADVDALSSRKRGSGMSNFFGFSLAPAQRRRLPIAIVVAHLPFLALAAWFGPGPFLAWLAVAVAGNWLYNGPGPRWSRVPALAEATATGIYLLILWLAILLSGAVQPWPVWALAAAAILVFQLAGAIVDVPADREVGKRTLAVAVGEPWAARALAAVLLAKAALFAMAFEAAVPAALNLAAVPFCLARPSLPSGQWAGVCYVYFVVVDWACLALLLP